MLPAYPSVGVCHLKYCVNRSRVCPLKAWKKSTHICKVGFCVRVLCALKMCQNVRRRLRSLSCHQQQGTVANWIEFNEEQLCEEAEFELLPLHFCSIVE